MEELTRLAVATCDNCGHNITLYQGMWAGPTWYHESVNGEGTRWCQDAPLATPRDGTVVDKTIVV